MQTVDGIYDLKCEFEGTKAGNCNTVYGLVVVVPIVAESMHCVVTQSYCNTMFHRGSTFMTCLIYSY